MKPRIETASLDVLMVQLFSDIDESNMPWLLAATTRLREHFGTRLIDLVPSYTTLMLHYDVQQLGDGEARHLVHQALENLAPAPSAAGQLHELPVWYDASVGPDLQQLALARNITTTALIDRHCARDYQVFCLGFVPGFAIWAWSMRRLQPRGSRRPDAGFQRAAWALPSGRRRSIRWSHRVAGTSWGAPQRACSTAKWTATACSSQGTAYVSLQWIGLSSYASVATILP